MAKPTTHFVCQSCGASHRKWAGRCDACGEWNTLVEEVDLRGEAAAAPPPTSKPARIAEIVDTAADVVNSVGGPQVAPVNDEFTLTDNIVISDSTAEALMSIFGR